MKKILISLLFIMGLCGSAWSQSGGVEYVILNAETNGTERPIGSGGGTYIFDDGGENDPYTRGNDFWVCITGTCDTPYAFLFRVEMAEIAAGDTMFIYDGPDPTYPLIWYSTNGRIYPSTASAFASPTNVDQQLTVRLKTADRTGNEPDPGAGFKINVKCEKPCETVTPHIDSIFYKTRNGQIYEFGRIKLLYDTDSVFRWDEALQDSVLDFIDSTAFYGVNLCRGDGVLFTAHCDYSYTTGWYIPHDSTTLFHWEFGNEGDTAVGVGLTSVHYDKYYKLACYDVTLHVTDSFGCKANNVPALRVRIAQNPLKTLFTLDDICNRDSLYVNMGYDGDNATLTLKKIDFVDISSKTYDALTYIPDGDNCGDPCYTSELEFSEFPAGSMVQSKGDICSVCINAEHSFIGDFDLALICPNYDPNNPNGLGRVVLKNKEAVPAGGSGTPGTPGFHPDGTGAGGGRWLGIPYGGNSNDSYDHVNGDYCDTAQNPPGEGWTYCFSRNAAYTLVNGEPADSPNPQGAGMGSANAPTVTITDYTFSPVPPGYTTGTNPNPPAPQTVTTLDSSDHTNKMNFFVPYDDFDKLVGCSLNGVWKIQLCDRWHIDNGWIFSWSLDICGLQTQGCRYQVPIDSIIWAADTSAQYCDYELGRYRGLEVHRHNDLESYILSPDTAGKFRINVTIFDEFGCVWDTNTNITTHWTPDPHLGNDTSLCGVFTTLLDATDRHAASQNYSYMWEPFGENTSTITTQQWPSGNINYVAQVTNKQRGKRCVTRDTIAINLRRQPMPSFMPTPFTLEGCDPLTLTFENQTVDGYIYHWDFGDGITSELESPTHTYSEGIYNLKYWVTSIDGCIDSLIYDRSIAVYAAPKAGFSWSPTYPSATNPVIHLNNLTEPQTDYTKYFWELQYNRDNALSVETLTETNPSFDYSQYVNSLDELPGNYTVRLISRTDNIAPSGNIVYCRDTAENTILVVNDYLTFPNVVTPNGDGINDIFVIGNLIDGMGYPNNTLDIFNKWGTNVYHKENISTFEDFWDPSGVPAGTYFYRFTAHGYNGNVDHNGVIEVIK